jgi:hypothetical protein
MLPALVPRCQIWRSRDSLARNTRLYLGHPGAIFPSVLHAELFQSGQVGNRTQITIEDLRRSIRIKHPKASQIFKGLQSRNIPTITNVERMNSATDR